MKYKYPVYKPTLSGNEKKYVNESISAGNMTLQAAAA